jgi:hypothetical protein
MLNMKPQLVLYTNKTSGDNNNEIKIGNDNNNEGNNDNRDKNNKDNNSKYKYVKVLVENPFNNRNIILKVSKKQKGIYV